MGEVMDRPTFLALLTVFGGLCALILVTRVFWRIRRAMAARPDSGSCVIRVARDLPTRLWVSRGTEGGPGARGINRGSAHLVLTDTALIVATRHGRVLMLQSNRPGSIR